MVAGWSESKLNRFDALLHHQTQDLKERLTIFFFFLRDQMAAGGGLGRGCIKEGREGERVARMQGASRLGFLRENLRWCIYTSCKNC